MIPRKPLSIRIIHWMIVPLFLIAYLTGEIAFSFQIDMRIRTRDALFAIHRLTGILAAVLLLLWAMIRFVGLKLQIQYFFKTRNFVKTIPLMLFHILLWGVALITPILPWIARSLDGRVQELYTLMPAYNLVSHPTTPLAYWLLARHNTLSTLLLYIIGIHILGALYHKIIRRDSVFPTMWFGR